MHKTYKHIVVIIQHFPATAIETRENIIIYNVSIKYTQNNFNNDKFYVDSVTLFQLYQIQNFEFAIDSDNV